MERYTRENVHFKQALNNFYQVSSTHVQYAIHIPQPFQDATTSIFAHIETSGGTTAAGFRPSLFDSRYYEALPKTTLAPRLLSNLVSSPLLPTTLHFQAKG